MKAKIEDATHWQQRHDEYWLHEGGTYYLYLNGYWSKGTPDFNGLVRL